MSSLKKHRSFVHDMDVVWYVCRIVNCEFKAKQVRRR